MRFLLASMIETWEILPDNGVRTIVRWDAEDQDGAPVVVDANGRKMLVTTVSLHIVEGSDQTLYLGGFPASKVAGKKVAVDPFPAVIEIDDPWAALVEIGSEFDHADLPSFGRIDLMETAHG